MIALSPVHLGLVAFLAAIVLLIASKLKLRPQNHRLPPGPKGLPIVGNVFDLPPKGTPEFQHWFKHKDTYGTISSVTVMGQTLIIFHDKEAAHHVMGRMAQKTSARPRLDFARLCGFENYLITHQFDDRYRRHRRMVHQEIGTNGLASVFQPVQEEESLRFVLQVLHRPDKTMAHLKKLAAAIVLKITYGYSIEVKESDPLVDLIEHAMDNLSLAFVPMSWALDAIPAIKYLPDWFPGLSHRKTAQEWRTVNEAAAEIPFNFVKEQLSAGTHRPSYTSNLLLQNMIKDDGGIHLAPEDEDAIKWSAVSLFAAGSDSTVAIIESVIIALVLFPEVVTRAQEEIDRIVGSERLPTFEDRKNLPYIDGIVKESWRWNPVGPVGLTHRSEEDIFYKGFFIPKGAFLLPSLWWFLHDPKDYPDPFTFKPERYMAPHNDPDPSQVAFGYGRRSCSGRYFADASVYITVVRLLAVFNVRKATDANGKDIPVKLEAVEGMVNRPKPFAFKVEPRSPHHADLLRRIESGLELVVGDASRLDMEPLLSRIKG